MMRDATLTGAVIAACLLLIVAPAAAQDATTEPTATPALPTIGQPASDGTRIVAVEELSPRARDLTIESPAVGAVEVRLLLPAHFEDRVDETFPTLYLLHGGGGQHDDWTQETDVERITASADLLVVMPAAASSNLGTWLPEGGSDGLGGPPDWERFHLQELRQLLERNWRAADQRAIAGLSLGGWGAVMSAARHPELFDAVASFSGALDLTASTEGSPEAAALVDSANQIAKDAGWGESNPVNLAAELDGLAVYVSYGNGEPGPLDDPEREPDPLEAWIGEGNDNFVTALTEAGVPATINAYGPGTHSWPYWEREVTASLPLLLAALGEE